MARRGLGAMVAATLLAASAGAGAEDRHAGYYYPPPQTTEIYSARVTPLPESDRARRLGFVTGLTKVMLGANYAPAYAIFAKGEEAEKMIIVGLRDGEFNTIYRARAVLAMLTAVARLTPFFRDNVDIEQATFLDLLRLLGFQQVTVSDGAGFAHQIAIE